MQADPNQKRPSQEIIDPPGFPKMTGSTTADRLKGFTTPLSKRGWPVWLVYIAAAIGIIYILNPTMGLFELIPDNIPFIGNLDEGVAFLLIWFGIVEYFENNPPHGQGS